MQDPGYGLDVCKNIAVLVSYSRFLQLETYVRASLSGDVTEEGVNENMQTLTTLVRSLADNGKIYLFLLPKIIVFIHLVHFGSAIVMR